MLGTVEDVRFDLAGYDDAVESWDEYLARILKEEQDTNQEAQYDFTTK
ncbi:hypothetical protein H8S23_05210 [Anaerofilum sp. BX8]|uniref:Uncharacterized protein n=1 Tax=Anaerofilum hominis TaxID=2763016 RepID=A0A923KVK5_9FIRM|nr:hypothetical protein [Anaerofilum hominis]MBC5580896.1 hypothetical protein [Anaerofilum hominis]